MRSLIVGIVNKMKKICFLFVILLLSLIYGCRGKSDNKDVTLYADSISISDSLMMLTPPMRNGAFNYDSIVEGISYLPLETNDSVLLSRIDDIKYFNGTIFIADYQHGKIFSFDEKGCFKGKIEDRGEGPKQYKRLCSFDIDSEDEKMYLLDGDLGNVHVYNFKMELIEVIGLPVTFVDHLAFYDNKLFLELGFREYRENDEVAPNLLLYDLDKKLIKADYFHFHTDLKIHFKMQDPVTFSSYNDDLYYWSPLGHSVYKYNLSQFNKEIEYDLSSYEVPIEIFGKRFSEALKLMREHKYAYIDRYYEFDDWHYVRISRVGSSAHYFYHKETGVGFLDVSFLKLSRQENVIMPELFKFSNSVCCSYISPEQYMKIVDEEFWPEINVDDNPILVFYELKT